MSYHPRCGMLLCGILTSELAEERSLVEFFGRDYDAYRKSTMTGIPFI